MKGWYLISYDVRDDKRLRKTAKKLEGYGHRMQYSIFRCHLNTRSLNRLRWELSKILAKEDNLLIIGLCERCMEKARKQNRDMDWSEDEKNYLIL